MTVGETCNCTGHNNVHIQFGHLTGLHSTNKDFTRGQVNGFVTTWTLKK
jgi:hypothetical protein